MRQIDLNTMSQQRRHKLPISQLLIIQSSIMAEDELTFKTPPVYHKMQGKTKPEDVWDASHFPPFDRLPRFLVERTVYMPPIEPCSYKPPVFHYGWRPNIAKLLARAQARKLTITLGNKSPKHGGNVFRPNMAHWPRSNRLGKLEYEYADGNRIRVAPLTVEEGLELLWPSMEEATVRNPAAIDVHATICAALKDWLHELAREGKFGGWCTRVRIARTLRVDDGENYVISVMTNGLDDTTQNSRFGIDRPTPLEVAQLGCILEVTRPPKWYVDRDDCVWCDYFDLVNTGRIASRAS